jgi:hypothetical protein
VVVEGRSSRLQEATSPLARSGTRRAAFGATLFFFFVLFVFVFFFGQVDFLWAFVHCMAVWRDAGTERTRLKPRARCCSSMEDAYYGPFSFENDV